MDKLSFYVLLAKSSSMRWVQVTFSLFFFFGLHATGQLSQNGTPLEIPALKSRTVPDVVMPAIEISTLRHNAEAQHEHPSVLKPLKFAHPFEVWLTPENHGTWVNGFKGYDVWRLTIKSEGAYSLNLIFSDFRLPDGARLFIYNEQQGHYLGAFTSGNNKNSGKFAVSPVAGDELTIQYEVPSGRKRNGGFTITQVNHDFTGILKNNGRRPLGVPAGSCNIDINCALSEKWPEIKDAVCRIIVNGTEICSGVLLNNSAGDGRPFVLSAGHCYDRPEYSETSVYSFNYESPYCAPLDGDPSNSVSGAVMKAFSDSLDFALVELTTAPPSTFHPYYAGWDRTGNLPDSTAGIHHPQGDIKKIAIDRNSPVISNFLSEYTPSGFIRILRWEEGVTEQGSSGSPLFNPSGQVIGTLTGGSATCSNPVNDYYSRFELAWEFKNDSSRQLKYWLDPLNNNPQTLPGIRVHTDDENCMELTYLTDEDKHQTVQLYNNNLPAGYWGGTNSINITEIAGRFVVAGEPRLYGVSLGVGLNKLVSPVSRSEITLNIYEGGNLPGNLIYSQTVSLRELYAKAMNVIHFDEAVEPGPLFFVGIETGNIQASEEFVLYQSLRDPGKPNNFWFRQDNRWQNFTESNREGNSMANVMSILACNVTGLVSDTPLVNAPMETVIYPNPVKDRFIFEAGQEISPEIIEVYNFTGQEIRASIQSIHEKKIQIDLSGNPPGVYFVRMKSELGTVSEKVIFSPR